MKVSILLTYYGDIKQQLLRTLWLLKRQTRPADEILILNDGAPDASDTQYYDYIHGLRYELIRGFRTFGAPERSPNMALNWGYQRCTGDYIIVTGAEIMPPLNAIETLLEGDLDVRQVPTQYYLDWATTVRLAEIDWRKDIAHIQTLPNFWATMTPWHYTNEFAKGYHNHISFCGMSRAGWDRTDFIPNTPAWGMNDNWLHEQEILLGRPAIDAGFEVYHQYHLRPKDMVGMSERVRRAMESQI